MGYALGPNISGLDRIYLLDDWICLVCGDFKSLDDEKGFWFDDRFYCGKCFEELDKCQTCELPTMYCVCGMELIGFKDEAVDKVQEKNFKSGLWE